MAHIRKEPSALVLRLLLAALVVIFAAAIFVPTSPGQAISGDMVGTVLDKSGAAVPKANVEVQNVATGVKMTAVTNDRGEYRFSNLPVGAYNVTASAGGFSRTMLAGINIDLNRTIAVPITLQVGEVATTVEVRAAATAIDTTTAQMQNSFDARQVQDLPIASIGLGVLNLALLNPGVASSGGVGAGTGPSVSGQRPRNNNFTIEGVDNNDKSVTGPLVSVPNDAVAEFTVLQNQFSPEFGHSSGGQFNQIVQSGTNAFHGRLYEYFRNRNLNAQDSYVARSQKAQGLTPFNTRYDNNRFGGQIGGPIVKNKLFFFTNHEYNPYGTTTSSSACAPTAAGYTILDAQASASTINANNYGIMKQYLTPAGQVAAAGSSCPASVVVNGATVPVGDIGFSGARYENTYTTVNSVDFNPREADQLRFRYIYSKFDMLYDAAQLPAFWTTVPWRYHVITLSEYHTFNPNVSNEFRIGFNRFMNDYGIPTDIKFPGLAQFPNISLDDMNGVNIGPDPNGPQWGIQNTYQLTDNLSWVKGKHSLKFGFEARKYIAPSHFVQRERGDYYWVDTQDYLLDLAPTDFGERSTGSTNYIADQHAIYWFVNDEWRIRPNLTFNLGLRYEFTSVPAALALQKLNAAASVPGLIEFGAPTAQKKNFAPRIGFAYSPGSSGNTSIRGGFGMAYDVLYDNLGTLSLPPQLTGTCDVGTTQTSTCYWSDAAFLASGGLPLTGAAPVFADVHEQRQATASFVPNQKLPYSYTWNLGVQHLFGKDYVAEVRYVGTRGIGLPVQNRLNVQNIVTPNRFLPTYLQAPTQAELDALPLTLDDLYGMSNYVPEWEAAGFDGSYVVGFMPWGKSIYHGLQTSLTRNFTNGLQFQVAWTWSHLQDNSTADVFSTLLTPRRPQDFRNQNGDWSTSALDRRHRLTVAATYEVPFFKGSSNWLAKNLIGGWTVMPAYTFQSPEMVTVQSAFDSNLNGDSWGDRTIFNPGGVLNTGSGITELTNSSGAVVAYLASNPNAQYIRTGEGALATTGRNTLAMPHINNWDLTFMKKVKFTERMSFELQAQALNVLNHAQYIAGYLNRVDSIGYTAGEQRDYVTPGKGLFNRPDLVFSNNPRSLQLVAKFVF